MTIFGLNLYEIPYFGRLRSDFYKPPNAEKTASVAV